MSGPQISCISASQMSSRSVIICESRERAESSFAVASGSALRRVLSTPSTAPNCSRIFFSSTTFWTGFAAALAFFLTGAFAFGAFAAAFFAGFELLAFGALRFFARARSTSFCHSLPPVIVTRSKECSECLSRRSSKRGRISTGNAQFCNDLLQARLGAQSRRLAGLLQATACRARALRAPARRTAAPVHDRRARRARAQTAWYSTRRRPAATSEESCPSAVRAFSRSPDERMQPDHVHSPGGRSARRPR